MVNSGFGETRFCYCHAAQRLCPSALADPGNLDLTAGPRHPLVLLTLPCVLYPACFSPCVLLPLWYNSPWLFLRADSRSALPLGFASPAQSISKQTVYKSLVLIFFADPALLNAFFSNSSKNRGGGGVSGQPMQDLGARESRSLRAEGSHQVRARLDDHLFLQNWCPGWESNPHEEKSPEDFKSSASAIPPPGHSQLPI